MFGLNLTAYLNWLLANIAGGIFGEWIASPSTYGLDFALAAMFIGLFMIQWTMRKKYRLDLIVAMSAVIVTIVGSIFISESTGIVMAIVIAASIGVGVETWK